MYLLMATVPKGLWSLNNLSFSWVWSFSYDMEEKAVFPQEMSLESVIQNYDKVFSFTKYFTVFETLDCASVLFVIR